MSYILDALKRAAEQRHGPPPEVRRLLSRDPVAPASPTRFITLGAVAVGVIAVGAVVWWWPDAPAPTPKPVAAVVAVPKAVAPSRAASIAPSRAPVAEKPRAPSIDAPRAPSVPPLAIEPRAAPTRPRVAEPRPSRTTPFAAPPVAPPATPFAAALPPAQAPAGPPRTDVSRLRLEVIVYAEQRPQRWVYISGRKYVEGDAIGDGARVEEIQSTGVVLVEDGRRITLRP